MPDARGRACGVRALVATEEARLDPKLFGIVFATVFVAELGDVDPAERFFEAFAPDRGAALARARDAADASVVEALDSGLLYVFPDGSTHARFTSIAFPADRAVKVFGKAIKKPAPAI